ncbi:hypothetical protein Y032_0283g1310 [Ancylostoma ceylanicum]|uniref:Uncharacterized protein n=1 Tax=Ancylostoma ceylanicum TaxID=53326 RepID=A0A016S7G2_9BILA|nr:hypothetical protein Y032_0283g1310 [Ancylostoma ceylanicum]
MRCCGVGHSFVPNWVDRNKQLGLITLSKRRDGDDVIMMFKILTGRVALNINDFFTTYSSITYLDEKINFPGFSS